VGHLDPTLPLTIPRSLSSLDQLPAVVGFLLWLWNGSLLHWDSFLPTDQTPNLGNLTLTNHSTPDFKKVSSIEDVEATA